MSEPLISVILPAYNHERYVGEAIHSVLEQTHQRLELIVIDDASSDETWSEICRHDDPRITRRRHVVNQGAHITLNTGLSEAKGELIAILNSDDQYEPQRLARCVEHLRTTGAELVGTDITLIDQANHTINDPDHWWIQSYERLKTTYQGSSGDWVASLLEGNLFMSTSNMFMTRRAVSNIGPFRDFRYVPDYEFLLRALEKHVKISWLEEALLRYRLHGQNTISEAPMSANRECANMLRDKTPTLLGEETQARKRLEHLVSQWQRLERYMIEIADTERHEALVTKETELFALVHDRDRWIAERDEWIRDRDQTIASLEKWLKEKDSIIWNLNQNIFDLNQEIAEKNSALTQLKKERETLVNSGNWLIGRVLTSPSRLIKRWHERPRVYDNRLRPIIVPDHAGLQRWLEPRIERLDLVSFDIFDTLLHRCIEPPDQLHRRLCDLLATHLGRSSDADTILQARREVEQSLRAQAIEDGQDHECHHDPLIERWIFSVAGKHDEELINWVHEQELALEKAALSAKPGVVELLEWLRHQSIRVIAVSDMYLSHRHIMTLLAHAGLDAHLDAVYVSSEFGLAKYSGRLHARVLEEENAHPDRCVHIGDNRVSDMWAPLQLGIQGVFLNERRERIRRRHQALSASMANLGSSWTGRHFFEIVDYHRQHNPPEKLPENDTFFHQYGATILGPAFATFNLGVVERCQELAPQRVFFLARDGFLFQKMYERWQILVPEVDLPLSEYVYASRRVVACASVADGLTLEQAHVALYNPKQRGLLSILKTFGLTPEQFEPFAKAHGLDPIDDPLHNWQDERLQAFLASPKVQEIIRQHGRESRENLEKYFEQVGFFGCKRAVLVDIGWNGTIQKFLKDSFGHRADYPETHGLYFAFAGAIHADVENAEGIIMDQRVDDHWTRAPLDFEEIFEQGARATEATTLGYRVTSNKVEPVLKPDDAPDRRSEILCNPLIEQFQSGVLEHLEHFHAAWRLTGYDMRRLRPYVTALLERAVVYPTRAEIENIGRLVHTEDFGHDHTLDISGTRLSLRDLLLRPSRTFKRLTEVSWRFGVITPLPRWLAGFLLRSAQLYLIRNRNH